MKGEFLICTGTIREFRFELQKGEIIPNKEFWFGISKGSKQWHITELTSGLRGNRNGEYKRKKDALNAVKSGAMYERAARYFTSKDSGCQTFLAKVRAACWNAYADNNGNHALMETANRIFTEWRENYAES